MTIDPLWLWVAGGAVAVLVLAGLISGAMRRRRTARLRERFGVEYDAVLRRTKSRSRTERELRERAEEAKSFAPRALTPEQQKSYRDDWSRLEARFVERPTSAVAEADELVGDVLRVQGYPPDFDRRAARLSVKSPLLVQHYRAGHEIIGMGGEASTEHLRQALLHYRMLFDDLVGGRGHDVVQPVITAREVSDPAVRERGLRAVRDEERLER